MTMIFTYFLGWIYSTVHITVESIYSQASKWRGWARIEFSIEFKSFGIQKERTKVHICWTKVNELNIFHFYNTIDAAIEC